jgi:hypothetical protein
VLAEIVFRLNDQRERREAAERAERDKQQAWRAAMAQARLDFQDSRRIEALDPAAIWVGEGAAHPVVLRCAGGGLRRA